MDSDDLLLLLLLGIGGFILWRMIQPAPSYAALPPATQPTQSPLAPDSSLTTIPNSTFANAQAPDATPIGNSVSDMIFDPNNDIDVATRTLAGEADNQPYAGKVAVMNVINNRFKHGQGSVAQICLAPGYTSPAYHQFSCWNLTDPNRSRILALSTGDPDYIGLRNIVTGVLSGAIADNTGGALNYYNPTLANPSWGASMQVTAQIGDQIFGIA